MVSTESRTRAETKPPTPSVAANGELTPYYYSLAHLANRRGDPVIPEIEASSGSFDGAVESRANVVELATPSQQASDVKLNGSSLPRKADRAAFEAAPGGWWNVGNGLVLAKTERLAVGAAKTFEFSLAAAPKPIVSFTCDNASTHTGEGVYVAGNCPKLGKWSAAAGVRLQPSQIPSRWTGSLDTLPPSTAIEWKCIIRRDQGNVDEVLLWEPGDNNLVETPSAGTVETKGDFGQDTLTYADFTSR